jgi:predicted NBD/HSP70 family sugar kinase
MNVVPDGDHGTVAGDPAAPGIRQARRTWLGHGLADLAAILDPRVYVIGGGVRGGELPVGPAAPPIWPGPAPPGTSPDAWSPAARA